MDLVLLFICPAWVLNHYSFNRTAMLAVFLQLLVLLWLALGLSAGALLSASLTRSVTLSFWWSAAPVLFGVWAFLVLMATAAVFRFKWKQRQLDGEDCFDCFGSTLEDPAFAETLPGQRPELRICKNCKQYVSVADNFCMFCGVQLKSSFAVWCDRTRDTALAILRRVWGMVPVGFSRKQNHPRTGEIRNNEAGV